MAMKTYLSAKGDQLAKASAAPKLPGVNKVTSGSVPINTNTSFSTSQAGGKDDYLRSTTMDIAPKPKAAPKMVVNKANHILSAKGKMGDGSISK